MDVTLPIEDRFGVTARFATDFLLDSRFAAGLYRVLYRYTVGSTPMGTEEGFEILGGGDAAGAGLGLYFFRHPTSDFLLQQTDGGGLFARRNPRKS